jgi:hypothetical protein
LEDLQVIPSLHKVRQLSLQRGKLHAEEYREQDSKKEEVTTEETVDMSHVRLLIEF